MRSKGTDRQHHVAQFYLRAWASDGRLLCLSGDRIFSTNPRDAAVQHRFYEQKPLSPTDRAFIKLWIEKSPEHSRPAHIEFVRQFSAATDLKKRIGADLPEGSPLARAINHQIINVEEEFHAEVEAKAAPLIARLRRLDASFYEDVRHSATFLHFLALQIMRTRGVKEKHQAGMQKLAPAHDVTNSWNIVSHILASNVGFSLYAERRQRRLILLENATGVGFVAGDQPVTNLLDTAKEEYSPFYPLSPTLALILTETDGQSAYSSASLTPADVLDLNRRIAEISYLQVFGRSRADLEPLLPSGPSAAP